MTPIHRLVVLALGLAQAALDQLTDDGEDHAAIMHLRAAIGTLEARIPPPSRLDPSLAGLIDAIPLPQVD